MTTPADITENFKRMNLSDVAATFGIDESQRTTAVLQDQVMTTIEDEFHPEPLKLSFLDLPFEIRLQIYGYLYVGSIGGKWSWTAEDLQHRSEMTTTRKSLRGLCKRVSAEWDRVFFSTATIVINNPKGYCNSSHIIEEALRHALEHRIPDAKRLWSTVYRSSPGTLQPANPDTMPSLNFDFGFLELASQHTLRNIRKMRYGYTPLRNLEKSKGSVRRNLEDLKYFATAVGRQHGNLESLEEITVSVPCSLGFYLATQSDDLGWSDDWEMWYWNEELWESVQACFQSISGLDTTQDWTVKSRVTYLDGTFQEDTPHLVQVVITFRVPILEGALVFEKAPECVSAPIQGCIEPSGTELVNAPHSV